MNWRCGHKCTAYKGVPFPIVTVHHWQYVNELCAYAGITDVAIVAVVANVAVVSNISFISNVTLASLASDVTGENKKWEEIIQKWLCSPLSEEEEPLFMLEQSRISLQKATLPAVFVTLASLVTLVAIVIDKKV